MKIKVIVVMVCCFLFSLPRAESLAATFPSGKSFSRIQTCTDRVNIYESAKPAAEGIGYSVANDCPNGIDLIALSAISSFGNLLLWASHGKPGSVVVEQCYATEDDANFRRTALEATAYRPGDLAVYFVDAVSKWGVALTTQGIHNTFSGDLAFVASCSGQTTAGNWATHEVGYADVTNGGTTRTDMTAVLTRLAAARNYDSMTVALALNGEQTLMQGDGDIALMPWVVSYTDLPPLTPPHLGSIFSLLHV